MDGGKGGEFGAPVGLITIEAVGKLIASGGGVAIKGTVGHQFKVVAELKACIEAMIFGWCAEWLAVGGSHRHLAAKGFGIHRGKILGIEVCQIGGVGLLYGARECECGVVSQW